MKAFVSHISEEAPIAATLKQWIEDALLGQCEVFVSSDAATLPAGVKWLDEINKALRSANVLLVLCSSASLPRPWVNFETGCAWAKGIPIIPLCHSGATKNTLPRPISEFQAIDLLDPSFGSLLFKALQVHFDLKRVPPIDHAKFIAEIASAVAGLAPVATGTSSSITSAGAPMAESELAPDQLKILKHLSKYSEAWTRFELAKEFLIKGQQMQYLLDELLNTGLIKNRLQVGREASYELSSQGRKYLVVRGML